MGILDLIIELPSGDCSKHRLWEDSHVIGREEDCDVTISSPDVSLRHLRIILDDSGCQLENLDSTSSPLLDGKPLTGIVSLSLPSEVRLGAVTLHLLAVEEEDLNTIIDNIMRISRGAPKPVRLISRKALWNTRLEGR